MAKKKKAAKKPGAKSGSKKSAKKVVKTPVKGSRKKPVTKKRASKKARPLSSPPGTFSVRVAPALEERLKALAMRMATPLDQILVMALGEFADNWEDHMHTVSALKEGDDRVQLVAPKD